MVTHRFADESQVKNRRETTKQQQNGRENLLPKWKRSFHNEWSSKVSQGSTTSWGWVCRMLTFLHNGCGCTINGYDLKGSTRGAVGILEWYIKSDQVVRGHTQQSVGRQDEGLRKYSAERRNIGTVDGFLTAWNQREFRSHSVWWNVILYSRGYSSKTNRGS